MWRYVLHSGVREEEGSEVHEMSMLRLMRRLTRQHAKSSRSVTHIVGKSDRKTNGVVWEC